MSTPKRTPLQNALIRLRSELRLTQQQLSNSLNCALPTVGKWETSRQPSGLSLLQIYAFAADRSASDEVLNVFEKAVKEEFPNFFNTRFPTLSKTPIPASDAALREMRRAVKYLPAMRQPFLDVLRSLRDMHIKLLDMPWPEEIYGEAEGWDETQEELENEIKTYEKESTKPKR
jgi:transcriptional regulator with XRE-family HTH domain